MARQWALFSGEVPPSQGGVADYTAQVAAGLAAAGDEVHLFAPCPIAAAPGVIAHPLPGNFGRRARRRAERDLAALPNAQWLIQYVPHAYGQHAMNVGFSRWIYRHRARRPWVMFHEVAVDIQPGDRWRRRMLARTTQAMARRLQAASARSLVAIPAWGDRLRSLTPAGVTPEWLPVPSNLPCEAAGDRRGDGSTLGWFGRWVPFTQVHLAPALATVLAGAPSLQVWLAGPGSADLRQAIAARAPAVGPRVQALGVLPGHALAARIASSDLMMQVYPDGLSSRRGTAMAPLSLGTCLLSHLGHNSESLWAASGAAALAPLDRLAATAADLLADPDRRCGIAAQGQRLYRERFSLEHTLARLREAP